MIGLAFIWAQTIYRNLARTLVTQAISVGLWNEMLVEGLEGDPLNSALYSIANRPNSVTPCSVKMPVTFTGAAWFCRSRGAPN